MDERRPSAVAGGFDLVGSGLAVIGLSLVVVSAVMIVAPGFFHEEIAPFGIRNDHYTIDGATFQLALGAGALAAVRLVNWRVPILAILGFQFALHATNHLVDIGDADPQWLGTMNFIVLGAGLAALIYLLLRAGREGGRR